MPLTLELKAGFTFGHVLQIPVEYADGYFAAGWTPYAHAIDANTKAKLADLAPTWLNPVTTRSIQILNKDTASWPDKVLVDVIFKRTSDGFVTGTETILVNVTGRVTVPAA